VNVAEAAQYLRDVYLENDYATDPDWDFQTFLNSIYDAGLDDYSETVVECYQTLQGDDKYELVSLTLESSGLQDLDEGI
jgi:hypothetical protein